MRTQWGFSEDTVVAVQTQWGHSGGSADSVGDTVEAQWLYSVETVEAQWLYSEETVQGQGPEPYHGGVPVLDRPRYPPIPRVPPHHPVHHHQHHVTHLAVITSGHGTEMSEIQKFTPKGCSRKPLSGASRAFITVPGWLGPLSQAQSP